MANEFRNAIARQLRVHGSVTPTSESLTRFGLHRDDAFYGDANVILEMPEMQAIRETLFDLTHPAKWKTAEGPRALHVENLRVYELPEHVIEWVLACAEESPS